VDYVFSPEISAGSNYSLTGRTTADETAFGHNFRTSGAMNGAVNTGTTSQALIGGVNNSIRSFLSDIATGKHYQSFIDFCLHWLCSPNIFDLRIIIDRHIKRKTKQL
jgi:hypothetical protein